MELNTLSIAFLALSLRSQGPLPSTYIDILVYGLFIGSFVLFKLLQRCIRSIRERLSTPRQHGILATHRKTPRCIRNPLLKLSHIARQAKDSIVDHTTLTKHHLTRRFAKGSGKTVRFDLDSIQYHDHVEPVTTPIEDPDCAIESASDDDEESIFFSARNRVRFSGEASDSNIITQPLQETANSAITAEVLAPITHQASGITATSEPLQGLTDSTAIIGASIPTTRQVSTLTRQLQCASHLVNQTSSTEQELRFSDHTDTIPQLATGNNNIIISETTPLLRIRRRPLFQTRLRSFKMAWHDAMLQTLLIIKYFITWVTFRVGLYTRWTTRRLIKKILLLVRKIDAWMILQPDRLPVTGAEMPPNGVSLRVTLMLLVNIIRLFSTIPMEHGFVSGLGKRTASLYMSNLPLLHLLSMRIQLLCNLTGVSHVHLNIYHRRLGEFMFFLAVLHSSVQLYPRILDILIHGKVTDPAVITPDNTWGDSLFGLTLSIITKQLKVVAGLPALVSFGLLLVNSTSRIRREEYNKFVWTHIPCHLTLQCFMYFHAAQARPYIVVALGIFMVDRFVFRYFLQTKDLVASVIPLQEGEISKLAIIYAPPRGFLEQVKRFIASYIAPPLAPGCHVFLKVTSLRSPLNRESHPYYVMNFRNYADLWRDPENIQLIIKSENFWSSTLIREALALPLTGIVLEGPYGSTELLARLRRKNLCILVASASGIGCILSMAQALMDLTTTGYNSITNTTTPAQQQVFVIVICNRPSDLARYEQQIRYLESHGIDCFPLAGSGSQLDELIEWELEARNASMAGRVDVVCCGPRCLQRAVRQTVSSARSAGYSASVDTLSFE